MKQIKPILGMSLMSTILLVTSCDKVSPTGVLVGGNGVNDRVDMSYTYYQKHMNDSIDMQTPTSSDGEYSFLVGSDSHVATDKGRIEEMIELGLEHGDLLWASLGDIADTSAEYYSNLDDALQHGKWLFFNKYFSSAETEHVIADGSVEKISYLYDERFPHGRQDDPDYKNYYSKYEDIKFPFYSAVGNHDVTRNGWALFSSIFHSSFFEFTVKVGNTGQYDHFIFLDTANGTLGARQIELLKENVLNTQASKNIRHTFVFSHTNLFRPSIMQFSSTFPREELYFLLNKFSEWHTTIVFCGHVHKWDDREVGGVRYLTLESMSERNSPNPGDYLVRITCKKDGTVDMQRVHMSYVAGSKNNEER